MKAKINVDQCEEVELEPSPIEFPVIKKNVGHEYWNGSIVIFFTEKYGIHCNNTFFKKGEKVTPLPITDPTWRDFHGTITLNFTQL